ncbi:PREDICTED: uncharacterized protein LOC101298433 [Fragaria vesca subsp. vesca]
MATTPLDSALTASTISDSDKAWHLLALLLSLGRRTRPFELAARCTAFPATAHLVQRLCSVANSPISLSEDLHVTPSLFAVTALAESVSSSCGDGALRTNLGKRKRLVLDCGFVTSAKRRLIVDFENVNDDNGARKSVICIPPKIHFHMTDYLSRRISMLPSNVAVGLDKSIFSSPLFIEDSAGPSSCGVKNIGNVEDQMETDITLQRNVNKTVMACVDDLEPTVPTVSEDLVLYEIDSLAKSYLEKSKKTITSPVLDENGSVNCKVANCSVLEDERVVGDSEEELLVDPHNPNGEAESLYQPYTAVSDKLPGTEIRKSNKEDFEVTKHVSKSLMTRNEAQNTCPAKEFYVPQKQLLKSSATIKVIHTDKISSRLQSLYGCNLEQDQAVATSKVSLHHKLDQKTNSMDQPEKKEFPNFDSYMVEEEEGSGGYGTVYRARSKNDRTRVAIKCPHANAHKSHVNNELRMLERFGGRNFVIKYEGCIKNGNSSCFVLQHVEHDRPEVLKREIDVRELRWYGYCLFRALASLHKQGIVHRDIKPGNFLFSRKANKGYLIDFNLSMDLHQKYGNISKSRGGFDVNSDEKLMTAKSIPPITLRKLPSGKSLLTANGETSKGLKSTFDMKDLKKMAFSQMKVNKDSGSRKVIKSQGADGSGITSVKDVTSTRTLSAERMREPLPCQGRKELINLVQEARESTNNEASSISALMRKRVPAPPVNVDGKFFHVTPMPMHSTSNGFGGPCLIRSREGPCAGTKGFRAPEVLLRSPHQGPKVDIWSAGVTLLYLLIGRTPFLGEPELNIKDIAKLRGSEDLWEVAKLHDRESSFPAELYSTDCLPSIKVKDWCRKNTRRPDFFEEIPRPLFDLVDKCLMVNPRVRISAEEALKHEFFAPCHEELRKHKLQRLVS